MLQQVLHLSERPPSATLSSRLGSRSSIIPLAKLIVEPMSPRPAPSYYAGNRPLRLTCSGDMPSAVSW